MIGRWRKRLSGAGDKPLPIQMESQGKTFRGSARNRILITMGVFFAFYAVIGVRLVQFGMEDLPPSGAPASRVTASRPDIVDRNGEVLATDIKTFSLFGEPRRIVDADEAIEKLTTVLPNLNYEQTYRRLKSGTGFVWLSRQLSPRQQAEIMALGIPGIGFRTEKKRFYPGSSTASHVLGLVNIDNKGISGMEKYVDSQGLADLQESGLALPENLEPFKLSMDVRVQHIVHDELVQAMQRYKAKAAGGVVLNAKTGEVVAMASVPDYDPNNPFNALEKDRMNRMSAGLFEMGSTFKSFTLAMALDSGLVKMTDSFDATRPLRIGRHTIKDFHGKHRVLTVPEVFLYSSNIGTGRMAEVVGIKGHQDYLTKMGLLSRMQTELPEVATPTQPKVWKQIHSLTISFGHGVSTTPLQTAVAAAAVVNGGKLINPTFLPRTEEQANYDAIQVMSEKASRDMRYLFRVNVVKGSGRRSDVPGYYVGGKTGTAEKVVNGRYSNDKKFNNFIAAFPIDDPQYIVLAFVDEPEPEEGQHSATAGLNSAVMTGNIIRRSAPLLGVKPDFGHDIEPLLVAYQ